MNGFRAARTVYGFSRAVGRRPDVLSPGTRGIVGGYNEDCSNLGREVKKTGKAGHRVPDEFPEFRVQQGEAQVTMHSTGIGKMYLDRSADESFAFQLGVPQRHAFVRDYHDETGQLKQKWDVGEENAERTFRDDTGHIVEQRREHEIRTTGFPESFKPRPMPHGDESANRESAPIPRRSDEMHLPTRSGGIPDTTSWTIGSTKVASESKK